VLPHREAAWKILRERLATLGDVANQLAGEPGLEALAGMATNLHSFAGDFRRHLEARAAAPTATTGR